MPLRGRSPQRAWWTFSTAAGRRTRSLRSRKAFLRSTRANRLPSSSCSRAPRISRRSSVPRWPGRPTRRATSCATPRQACITCCSRAAGSARPRCPDRGRSSRPMRFPPTSRAFRRLRSRVRCCRRSRARRRHGRRWPRMRSRKPRPCRAGTVLRWSSRTTGRRSSSPKPGTSLSRAINASVPVIQTAPGAFYAVKAGIWFAAAQAAGPWSVATSVPAPIYAIPPTSPIFFVTFVRIYGSTPDVVFEGYTPGYLGAMPGVRRNGGVRHRLRVSTVDRQRVVSRAGDVRPRCNAGVQSARGLHVRLRRRPRDGRMVAAVLRRRAIPSGLLGPLPVLRHGQRQRVSRVVQACEGEGRDEGAARRPPAATTATATPPAFDAAAATAYANSGPQVPIRHMGPERGYDLSMSEQCG